MEDRQVQPLRLRSWEPTDIATVWRRLAPDLAGYLLPFVLITYLSLKGGGYDELIYSEIGILAWWIAIIGILVGVLPGARVGRTGWAAMAVFAAFCVWTALGIGWAESAERGVGELGRLLSYLGVFALATFAQRSGSLRRTIKAACAAIGLVALLALGSRIVPEWFPESQTHRYLPGVLRLNYPLNYWNGLAALMAMGVPLALVAAAQCRTLVAQALAAASIPVLILTAFFTASRGGVFEIAVAVIVLLLLYPRRLALAPTALLAAAGSGLLIAAASQRDALADGLLNETARTQGHEMLGVVVVVCGGVALLQVAIGLAARHEIGPRLRVSRQAGQWVAGAGVVLLIAAAAVFNLPETASDRYDEFKNTGSGGSGTERLSSASGNGRYQYWEGSVDAGKEDALTGIGPGQFEFWWAENGSLPGFIRNAHSLYFETFAELGFIGVGLIVLFIGLVIAAGARASFSTRSDSSLRALTAGATAACAAFAAAALVDWVWQLAVLPVAFLLLAAALLRARSQRKASRELSLPLRLGTVGVAVVAIVVIAIPLGSASAIRDSQEHARAAQLTEALADARAAQELQPYAASPYLQEALILEVANDLDGAAVAARQAAEAEPTNWRTWLVLSRVEAQRGRAVSSVEAYRRARSLNPRSPLFANG